MNGYGAIWFGGGRSRDAWLEAPAPTGLEGSIVERRIGEALMASHEARLAREARLAHRADRDREAVAGRTPGLADRDRRSPAARAARPTRPACEG